ncbi:chromosomal replication initiator protein DnaA [Sphingomonas baiyangensis]|uniref:Chromosomal replication initiator protein DnaA n=1 Tax=Sphingomonas baiyangensis TaxID=2572576 RepID=A0A4V5PV07_9SPHN|nr:chromosomal replication initiator protein DnaA [Sphingomonas baiyangensis]TKD52218.1 chromosomal replication initiator protein DnaA [Sphingomonas baiyangensis]
MADAGVAIAWEQVRRNLRAAAGAKLFDQWIKPAALAVGTDGECVRLTLPSRFMANYVRSHYAERLLLEFRQALPGVRTLVIDTGAALPERVLVEDAKPASARGAAPLPVAAPLAAPAAAAMPARDRFAFDARFTFDRFVTDASNRVAANAARALAAPGVPQFSPLYLHGGTGQGKTHLLHATGHAFHAAHPQATALYMPAERFMFEFVKAMRARDTFSFKERLRGVDLLLIDDLQFIAGKETTQEEFFHTVNECMTAGKRLVIAADRSPQLLDGVEPRLVSRLGAGLVVDIKAPDYALRHAILSARLAEMPHLDVPADVIELLAMRITANIRELEGALNRLVAYGQLVGEAITMDFALQTLGELLRGAQKRVTIDEIQKAVSAHYEVKQLDLVSERRAVAIARPRQIAMYLAKKLTTRSLPEIGRKFGNRDHSTVIHAVRRIEDLRGKDSEIDGAVRNLMRQLEG